MTISRRDVLAAGAAGLAGLFAGATNAAEVLATGVMAIPFTYTKNRRMLVDVSFGYKGPYPFMVDTGARGNGITERLAFKLGLKPIAQRETSSLAIHSTVNAYTSGGGIIGGSMPFNSLELNGLDAFFGEDSQGLLGAWLLTGQPSIVDFDTNEIRIYASDDPGIDGFVKLNSLRRRAVATTMDSIYVVLKVDGHEATCLVDTGATVGIYLGASFVSRHGLWDALRDSQDTGAIGAVGENLPSRIGRLTQLDFGAFQIADPEVALESPSGPDFVPGDHIDGILGMSLLQDFTLALPKDGALYVKPRHNSAVQHPL